MNRTAALSSLLICFCISFTDASDRGNRPNVILIMADDLGMECLGSYGSLEYQTPVLDNLAARGVRFNYCFSQPLCTPSRVKIMTGRYNHQNYVDFGYLDVEERTFGNLMKEAGYRTVVAGKWQLNGVNTREPGWDDLERPYQFGFDEYCLWWFTQKGPRYAGPLLQQNKEIIEPGPDAYGPDVVSDYIVDFIGRHRDHPFFVYYPMILVHSPFVPTPDSRDWGDPAKRVKNDIKYFGDMVEYMDKIVGKILDKVREEGLEQNTVIMFTGDNGTHKSITTSTIYGDYPGGKGSLLDNGNRVPLIVYWAGSGGRSIESDDLVEFSDFYPTLADIAGAIDEHSVGKSFLPLIQGAEYQPRETVYVHYDPRTHEVSPRAGRFVRNQDYKLYYSGEFVQCYPYRLEENKLDVGALDPQAKSIYITFRTEMDRTPDYDFTVPHRILPE